MAGWEYSAFTLATIHGISKDAFDSKMASLKRLRDTLEDTVFHKAYDISKIQERARELKEARQREAAMLDKVRNMGRKS